MAKYVDDFDLVLRPSAYACVLLVVGVTKFLGGSWVAFVLGFLIVGATGLLLPTDKPRDGYRNIVLAWLRTIRGWRWPYRFACCLVLVGGVVSVDAYFGELSLGRAFNVNLIPIYISSLLFGTIPTFVTCLLVFLAVDYFVIPPRNSFEIVTIQDAVDLLIFIGLSWLVFISPQMLYKSSIMDDGRRRRSYRAEFF